MFYKSYHSEDEMQNIGWLLIKWASFEPQHERTGILLKKTTAPKD